MVIILIVVILLAASLIGCAAMCKGPPGVGATLVSLGLPLPGCAECPAHCPAGDEDLSYVTDDYLQELAGTDPDQAATLALKRKEWEGTCETLMNVRC